MDEQRIEVLGGARLCRASTGRQLLERKTAALLAYLSIEGETARGRLAGLLWPESREATARNNLSQLLRRLRELMGEPGVEGREALRLREGLWVDVKVLLRGEPGWLQSPGGELLAGLSYDDCEALEDWLRSTRLRILEFQHQALEAQLQFEEHEGRLPEALEVAQRMLRLEPTSEEAFRHLMRLHHRLGNRRAALQVWRQCEEVLERELGIRPSAETRLLASELEKMLSPPSSPSSAPARRALPLAVVHPPLLAGREREWAQMEEAWRARLPIFVVGPAGVGKSRLMVDFASTRGRWLLLRARPGDLGVTYATHTRYLREVLQKNPGLVLEDWVRRELSRLLPELGPEALPLPSPDEKSRFFAAILHMVRQSLRDLDVLAFEDGQYIDEGSSELSLYLLSQLQEDILTRRFPLIIFSERIDETLGGGVRMRQMAEAGQGQWVQLDPLGPEAVRALLRSMEVPALEHMSEDIARYTGGNPLFVVETAKHLVETDGLEGNFPQGLPPPGRARAIIQRRLERLSSQALRLAQVIAVAGADMRIEQAAGVLELPVERLVDAWQELEEAALVRGTWFSHDLVGEALLGELPLALRELLSQQLSQVQLSPGRGGAPAR